jgi:hypothetical protein
MAATARAVETAGSTILSTAEALLTRITPRRTNSAALRVATPCPIGKQMHVRIKAKAEGSRREPQTVAEGSRRAMAIARPAVRAVGTAWAIAVCHQAPVPAPEVVVMPSVVPPREEAGAAQGRAVREALPVWEAPEAEEAAGAGEGKYYLRGETT